MLFEFCSDLLSDDLHTKSPLQWEEQSVMLVHLVPRQEEVLCDLGVRLGRDIHTFATVAVYLLTSMSSRTPPRRGTPNTRIVAVCLNTVLDIIIEQYNTVH